MKKKFESQPNYAYCSAYCLGKMPGCLHYVKSSPAFMVCKHYKLLQQERGERLSRDLYESSNL